MQLHLIRSFWTHRMHRYMPSRPPYSPPLTESSISAYRTASETILEVQDQGPGISPAERESALRRFHRLEGAAASGSGLGLSIVESIAQLHKAQLDLLEGAEGKGLKIRLRFAD